MMRFFLFLSILLFIGCNEPIVYPPGGYDYPKEVKGEDTNFYFYPLKELESKKDLIQTSRFYLNYRPFDEENLSIKAQEKATFRLFYGGFSPIRIITLVGNLITIKSGTDEMIFNFDRECLSEEEKKHLQILELKYPIDTAGQKPEWKHFLDSMTKKYPQLLDEKYYNSLMRKAVVMNPDFRYKTKKVRISNSQYHSFVEELNATGFWSFPYEFELAGDAASDGDYFFMEANTKEKYQVVTGSDNQIDVPIAYKNVCQRLVNMAGLNKEISIYHQDKSENN